MSVMAMLRQLQLRGFNAQVVKQSDERVVAALGLVPP